jgi:hypothetical protein
MVTGVACLLGGFALGLRFKVFILIPAVTVAAFFVGIGAIIANSSAWSTLLTLVGSIAGNSNGISDWHRRCRCRCEDAWPPTAASSGAAMDIEPSGLDSPFTGGRRAIL